MGYTLQHMFEIEGRDQEITNLLSLSVTWLDLVYHKHLPSHFHLLLRGCLLNLFLMKDQESSSHTETVPRERMIGPSTKI